MPDEPHLAGRPAAPGQTAPELPRPSLPWRIVEDVLLVLAIFPLWPRLILGWPGRTWEIMLWADLAFLLVLLAVRWSRVRAALNRMRDPAAADRAPGPAPRRKDCDS